MDNKELLESIRIMLKEELKKELDPIKIKLEETYNMVSALEHSSQVNKAEQDNVKYDIAELKGTYGKLEIATAENTLEIARLKHRCDNVVG